MKTDRQIFIEWAATYGDSEADIKATTYGYDLMLEFAKFYYTQKQDPAQYFIVGKNITTDILDKIASKIDEITIIDQEHILPTSKSKYHK